MFFLLATFVMVSTAMIKNKGIPVHLPTAETGERIERRDYASISITDSGELYFDKEKVSTEEMALRLKSLKEASADPKVFLNGDGKAQLEMLVVAIDKVRKAGITKIGLETAAEKNK